MLQQFDERNRDLLININGELLHRDRARISPFDSAVQGGDAVWEGLRLYDGRIFKLREHLHRLRNSAEALAFAEIPSDEAIIEQISRTLAANNMRDGVHLRLTLTRGLKVTSGMDPRLNRSGPTLIVLAEHKAPVYSKAGLSLITSKIRRPPPEILDPQIHHANLLNSILAKIEANNAGADDALMLDLRGFVAERMRRTCSSCGTARSRPATCSRARKASRGRRCWSFAQAHAIPHREADLTLDDVYAAEEMFCTGTMGELAGVTRVDGRTIGSGEVGPMTTRLSELYRHRTASQGVQVA
jgi:branched-chain amino acid aminotransferase